MNSLVKIIPAIRILALKKVPLKASLIQKIDGKLIDTAEKLRSHGICNNGYDILEIEEDKTDLESLKKIFNNWYRINDYNPQCVAIQNYGSIHLSEIELSVEKPLSGKICVITGAGQGFGAGIAEMLFQCGANIVIADINEEVGKQMEDRLNEEKVKNRAFFVKTDVSNPDSVESMISRTILQFGGLDVMISNAGILYAGGLEEMTPEIFQRMTNVNYTGYFYCAKYAAEIMKIQTSCNTDYFCDILQINSKSGLQGSKKNFAYAGGKFGGVGLTQSFALELMTDRIKVNSICPGNFFEGPLWSDPEKGLFVQYLKAGKVPGAKNIEDVRDYYEKQVPAGRGCRVEDVVKAILYAIDQKYETGQAIPVTGGQIMLH